MNQCSEIKPKETDVCYGFECNQTDKIENLVEDENEYLWSVTGFTNCSANCLGGTQESITECIRKRDQKKMPLNYCDLDNKPEAFTKICNDHPCIPRLVSIIVLLLLLFFN